MGDGQHVWAAAEWILMMRSCFVREEKECLVLAAGISKQWLASKQGIHFGPAATSFGDISITIEPQFREDGSTHIQHMIRWQGRWHDKAPRIEVRLPGQTALHPMPGENSVICKYTL
jgi:hypothetical protein